MTCPKYNNDLYNDSTIKSEFQHFYGALFLFTIILLPFNTCITQLILYKNSDKTHKKVFGIFLITFKCILNNTSHYRVYNIDYNL